MTMRRHEREAAWEVPTKNHFSAEVRIDMRGGVCHVSLPGTGWLRFDTWDDGVAHAERTLGRRLLPEMIVRRRESWVDGTGGHAVRLESTGTYSAEAWSVYYDILEFKFVRTQSNGDIRASQDKIETWEAAITAGQRLLGALRALL